MSLLLLFNQSSGAVTHDTTGVLAGQGSTVAGSANRFRSHPSSGALTGQGSTVAGSAARSGGTVTHDTSGSLVGPGSALSGFAIGPAVVSRVEQPAGRKKRISRKKVFVEKDGEILLFDSPEQAFAYLQATKEEAVVKRVVTGSKVRKPKELKAEVKEIETFVPEKINLQAIYEYVDYQKLAYDVEKLIKTLNIAILLDIQERMLRDEDDAIVLILMDS